VDHILGVEYIQSHYKLPFQAHQQEERIVNNAAMMGKVFGLDLEPIEGIDQLVADGDQIKLGDHHLESIHVPGHSPGSISYHSPDGGFVITGDALFQGSIGRTDLPGGDYDQLIQSIEKRLMTLPPETVVYPGHGPSSTIGSEKRNNPFLSMAK
jgi:glyoxylase-like metal-dependent hydrolase (beta-lactamase superfamily II)